MSFELKNAGLREEVSFTDTQISYIFGNRVIHKTFIFSFLIQDSFPILIYAWCIPSCPIEFIDHSWLSLSPITLKRAFYFISYYNSAPKKKALFKYLTKTNTQLKNSLFLYFTMSTIMKAYCTIPRIFNYIIDRGDVLLKSCYKSDWGVS